MPPCNRPYGPGPPSVRPYDGGWSSAVSRRMTVSEELTPENPETPENEAEEPIERRKNGLYPGVSDELAENMKSGWADTELRDLEPIAQAAETAARRAALSARFPGERLSDPRGQPEDPLERHGVLLPRLGRVRLPHRQPDRGRRPGHGAQGRRPHRDDLPPAALRPRERRVLARRPGRAVGRPPPLPHRGGEALRHPRLRRARAGRQPARGHRPGARRARLRRRRRGGP